MQLFSSYSPGFNSFKPFQNLIFSCTVVHSAHKDLSQKFQILPFAKPLESKRNYLVVIQDLLNQTSTTVHYGNFRLSSISINTLV